MTKSLDSNLTIDVPGAEAVAGIVQENGSNHCTGLRELNDSARDCVLQQPTLDNKALSPRHMGPSDEAADLADAAAGEMCGDGETWTDSSAHVQAKQVQGETSSASSKVTWKAAYSPKMSPQRSPKKHHAHRSNSCINISNLCVDDELAEGHAVSPIEDMHAYGTPLSRGSFKGSLVDENGNPHVLEHTIGTVKQDASVVPHHDDEPAKTMRRSASTQEIHHEEDEDEESSSEDGKIEERLIGDKLLVVFDMDHTMVGSYVRTCSSPSCNN